MNEEQLAQEEISSLGDLKPDWSHHQLTLATQHSTLISMYGIALSTLQSKMDEGKNNYG